MTHSLSSRPQNIAILVAIFICGALYFFPDNESRALDVGDSPSLAPGRASRQRKLFAGLSEQRRAFAAYSLAKERDLEGIAGPKERQLARWTALDAEDARLATDSSRYSTRCGVCGRVYAMGDIPTERRLVAKSLFSPGPLLRFNCSTCGAVFGPENVLAVHPQVLSMDYADLYSHYTEGSDITRTFEVAAFRRTLDAVVTALHGDRTGRRRLRLLDYGCGIGLGVKDIVESGMLEQSAAEKGLAGIDVVGYDPVATGPHVVNNKSLLLAQGQFDGIFSSNVLEHFQDPVEGVRELRAMLRPSASSVVVFATPCQGPNHYIYEGSHYHTHFFPESALRVLGERTGLLLQGVFSLNETWLSVFRWTDG
ncbi:hypothetical protein DFJ74DRAFT_648674 [Hyaloraphidium curvatum]|nr:hypothetical protein DFJ74DRAFT_648674 [Hyaloraphidium curvatum]